MFDVKAAGFCCVLGLETRRNDREGNDEVPDGGLHQGLTGRQNAPVRSSAHGLGNFPRSPCGCRAVLPPGAVGVRSRMALINVR